MREPGGHQKLDVAMDKVLFVYCGETRGNLRRNFQRQMLVLPVKFAQAAAVGKPAS